MTQRDNLKTCHSDQLFQRLGTDTAQFPRRVGQPFGLIVHTMSKRKRGRPAAGKGFPVHV